MRLTVKVLTMLSVILIVVAIPAIILIWQNQQNSITQQARVRAITLHQMIVVTRQWVAENRDRIEPVPAQATKELSLYANFMSDFRFHITSDILLNPENEPDEFEKRAIKAFRKGATEYADRDHVADMGDVYRYAAPLQINDSCLPCHANQGYNVGDFRGLISVMIPLADLEAAVRSSNIALIAAFITGLLLTVFILIQLLYRFVLSPINALTDAAGKIRGGDYNINTNINTNDEIHELSEAFDMMSAQIAKNEDNLKTKLSEAVQKYVDIVDELKEKNIQLDTLNQLKTDLLDSIAHEIRTPITKIMSYSELLNDPRLQEPSKRSHFAELLKRNVQSLNSMFNDIITMSRLEHGQYTYHKIPLAIRELVEKVAENFEREATDKNVSFNIDIDRDIRIIVDGESFKDVISNIIGNAVKYSHPSTEVHIKVYHEGDNVVISCLDNGVGIPQDDLTHVSDRFRRGSNVKAEYPGTGLGLAIVERVVRSHGGTLNIDSVQGKFTEIEITLPLNPEEEA